MLFSIPSFSETEVAQSRVEDLAKKEERKVIGYKPIYLAYGEPSTKIQFSFRSEMSDTLPINFGYTQIIFWNLREESKPFYDATYNPEFFYRWRPFDKKWTMIDFGIWEHNSNGKASLESRSFDQSYVRGVYLEDWGAFATLLSVKLKFLYNLDDNNENIKNYVGPVDIDLHLVQIFEKVVDQAELILSARPGGVWGDQFDQGGYQVALNFHFKGIHINPAFYLQYYHGYAETLVNYNKKVDEFRIGFMF